MASRMVRILEVIAYVCVIAMTLTLTGNLVRQYLRERDSGQRQSIALSKIEADWAASRFSLLFALSTKCQFCWESADFYRKLIENANIRKNVHIIAVLPQPVGESERFLSDLHLGIGDVRQIPLTDLGIEGTPTLILVGSDGKVIESWPGKMTAKQESQLLDLLESSNSRKNWWPW